MTLERPLKTKHIDVVSQQHKPLLGTHISYWRVGSAALILVQLPSNTHPGRWKMVDQVFGPCAQQNICFKFLAPSFSLPIPKCCDHLESEPTNWRSFSALSSLFLSAFQKK